MMYTFNHIIGGTIFWHTGVGPVEFIEQHRTILKETKSLIINDLDERIINLAYHEYVGNSLMTLSRTYVMQESVTLIDNATVDTLIILNRNTLQLNNILNISHIVINSKSSIIIPYNTILILPKHYIFFGKEIILKGTIIGADFFELSNYSKVSIYPNSSWHPTESYHNVINDHNRHKNIINITNFVLNPYSGLDVMGGDVYSFMYLKFHIGNLSIRYYQSFMLSFVTSLYIRTYVYMYIYVYVYIHVDTYI
jgi:hypothetical protein